MPPAAAPTRAAVPARPAASYPSGPPDPDLDAFADTLTDSPDVPMLDFPVLTDAVEPARARPRAETAYVKPPVAPAPAAAAPKPATPLPRVVAPASTSAPAQTPRAAKPAPAPAPAPPQPAPAATAAKPTPPPPRPSPPPAPAEDEDLLRQTQTMRGLMAAKSIDDISDSMAETLFGDADLDMLSKALAASGWSEDEASAATAASAPKPAAPKQAAAPAEDDPFDFLGLGPDAPLELIEDPEPAPEQRREGTRNR
jgi:hypothetical protein